MKVVFLEYSFIFDPADTWSHIWEFEEDLAKFFEERGLEALTISSVDERAGKRLLYISKKQELVPPIPEEKESVKQRIANMRQRRTPKGKFVKPAGAE